MLQFKQAVATAGMRSRIPWVPLRAVPRYERPHRFVDEQESGPFRTWWHEHSVHASDAGVTVMLDRVHFEAPLEPLGRAVGALVLCRYLTRLLEQRNAWLKAALAAMP